MNDIKIKDVNLVNEVTGKEKIPVSNGSGKPAAVTVNLILDKVDLSDYATTETLNLAVQAVNSNINDVNQSINTRLQNVSETANKADTTATDALNLAEGIQGNLSSFALKSELPTKVSQLENNVDYLPNTIQIEKGVYIVDLDGNLQDPNTFTGTADDVTGIGLVTDNGKWIVALDEWYSGSSSSSTAWNGNAFSAWGGYDKTVTGCFINSNQSQTLLDFDGEANTDAIIAQLQGTTDDYSQYYTGAPAAEYCRAYSKGYKDVGSWYLPATGELNEIVLNKYAIDAILTKLRGDSLSKNPYTWSSSQCNNNNAWLYDWSNSRWRSSGKYDTNGVRPICKLGASSITSRIESLEDSISGLENSKANKSEIPNIIYFNPETFNAEKFEELSSLLWPDGDGLSHTLVVCLDRNEGGVTAYVCDVRDYDAECIYLSYLRPGAPLSPLDSFDHIPFFVDQYKLLKDGTIDKYTLVMTKPDRLPISTLPSEATLEEVVTAYNDLVSKLIEIGTLIEPDDDVVVEED